MANGDFDFNIRDELKRMPEFSCLRAGASWVDSCKTVTGDMMVDMITYCARGDLDLAIRGLRLSKQFADACVTTLQLEDDGSHGHYILMDTFSLLFEIWRLAFITTKCVLDYDWEEAKLQTPAVTVLEDIIHVINNDLDNMQFDLIFWVKFKRESYRQMCLIFNEVIKNLAVIKNGCA